VTASNKRGALPDRRHVWKKVIYEKKDIYGATCRRAATILHFGVLQAVRCRIASRLKKVIYEKKHIYGGACRRAATILHSAACGLT
jgi:hypothetical protein